MHFIGTCRGDVVQWREADLVIGEEQAVVLGVSVGSRDEPVPDQGIGKPPDGVVSSPRRHGTAEELGDVGRTWASLILVLERRRECESLAEILLMDSDDLTPHLPPVVTDDHYGGLVPEPADLRPGSNQPGTSGSVETEVLVQVVVVKRGDRRLEDVGGRGGAEWNTPTPILEEQSRLRLGSSEAELPGEGPPEPRRRVFAKVPQALSYFILGEPGNPPGRATTRSISSGGAKRIAPAQSSPIWVARSENGEDNETWKWRAQRARTAWLSGRSPHNQGVIVRSECDRTWGGIESETGVAPGRSRYSSV